MEMKGCYIKNVIEIETTEYHINGTVSVSDAEDLLIVLSEYASF